MIKLCYISLQLKTHFNAKVIDPVTQLLISVSELSGAETVIQSVILYDGTSWSASPQWIFQYNDTDGRTDGTNYGDVTQVALPTGGTVAYTWATKTFCPGAATHVSRSVVSRTINANDGKGNQTTTYAATAINGIPAVRTTDPAGNDTVHAVGGLGGSCSYYETEVDYYKGSSTAPTPVLLKIVQTAYSWTSNPLDQYGDGTTTVVNVVPTSVTTKYPIPNTTNYLVSEVQTDYDNSFNFYPNNISGGTYGRITEKREYGFGLNSPGSLLRKTDYSYEAVSGNAYLTANLLDLVGVQTVSDGSGNRVAQTINTFDGTTLQSSGVTMQHASLANPGTRGNRTMTQQWLSGPGTMVTTQQTQFYDTGMPY
jgi:hypothetical protein